MAPKNEPNVKKTKDDMHLHVMHQNEAVKVINQDIEVVNEAKKKNAIIDGEKFKEKSKSFAVAKFQNLKSLKEAAAGKQNKKRKSLRLLNIKESKVDVETMIVQELCDLLCEIQNDLEEAMNDDKLELSQDEKKATIRIVQQRALNEVLAKNEPSPKQQSPKKQFLREAFLKNLNNVEPQKQSKRENNNQDQQHQHIYDCLDRVETSIYALKRQMRMINCDPERLNNLLLYKKDVIQNLDEAYKSILIKMGFFSSPITHETYNSMMMQMKFGGSSGKQKDEDLEEAGSFYKTC